MRIKVRVEQSIGENYMVYESSVGLDPYEDQPEQLQAATVASMLLGTILDAARRERDAELRAIMTGCRDLLN